jgi:virginiamycin B lyase
MMSSITILQCPPGDCVFASSLGSIPLQPTNGSGQILAIANASLYLDGVLKPSSVLASGSLDISNLTGTHTIRLDLPLVQGFTVTNTQTFRVTGPGETGLPDGSQPNACVEAPDGRIWFVASGTGMFGRIDSEGTIEEVGLPTSGALPYDIALGPDGQSLWVSEYNKGKIARITNLTSPVSEVTIDEVLLPAGAGASPRGIRVGPDGNLWVAGWTGSKITKLSNLSSWPPTMTDYTAPGGSTAAPVKLANGSDGRIYFAEYNAQKVISFDPSSPSTTMTTVASFASNSDPFGVDEGPDGNIWVSLYFTRKLVRVTGDGAPFTYSLDSPGQLRNPWGLAAGIPGTNSADSLWIAEIRGPGIGRFKPSTGTLTDYPVPTVNSKPHGICPASDGKIWYTEFDGNNVGYIVP